MEDQNQNIKTEPSELEKCQQEKEEYLSNWKRERADFLNYKKDETRRMEEFLKFSTEGIIMELVDVLDEIEIARNNLPDSEELKEWTKGFDSSLDKLDRFLKKFGVEKIKVKGDPSTGSGQVKFDPLLHEAVTTETRNGVEKSEEEIEEIRPGYTMHGRVIRPARVRIIN